MQILLPSYKAQTSDTQPRLSQGCRLVSSSCSIQSWSEEPGLASSSLVSITWTAVLNESLKQSQVRIGAVFCPE